MDFINLASLALHLVVVEAEVKLKAESSLKKAAQVIEDEAKSELGYYQPEKGPYPGWKELAESTLKTHAAYGVGDTPLMFTGGLYASIEHEAHGSEAVVGSKLDIAMYQEFGTDKIPPRPFIGAALFTSKGRIEKIMANGLVSAIVSGNAVLD
jgi:HK97 gp10 family phage protein